MALSQIEIIKSLGRALEWLEKELTWGSPAAELRHLTGRIGELYVAMITLGQLADSVNQQGYDVISSEGEKISVKTVTSSNHVSFNKSTFHEVDRVIIIKINSEDMQLEILEDISKEFFGDKLKARDNKFIYSTVKKSTSRNTDLSNFKVINSVFYKGYKIVQLENLSIQIFRNDESISPVKPVLRELSKELNISEINSMGNLKNTRTLGDDVIKVIKEILKE
ncbi:hypothetical protein M5F03_00665 [Acinetobacter sp. ANC 5579]|uniref:DUF6998 domain-containing protein n=1 Tax=Acinetobacter amyesii TaxID=2942470 RepID=UPI0020C05B5F|nr:hypothetical protein [Acinetobacter amyesii]MCL6233696.1 hypothetical protein [Acinetobacter amyesii]